MSTKNERTAVKNMFSQAAVFAMIRKGGGRTEFHESARYAYGRCLRTMGATECELFRLWNDAEDWAKQNCPALVFDKACQPGCTICEERFPTSKGN